MPTTVYLRDASLARAGVLQPLGGEVILRENGVGTWWLEADATKDVAARAVEGGGVFVIDDETHDPIWSGPFTKIERNAPGDGPRRVLRLSGVTDDVHLFDRETLPDPSLADTAQSLSADSHYTATGVAETVARALVNTQAGPGALVDRRVTGLALQASDGLNGSTVSISARYTPSVGELLAELAVVGGIAWRVIQVGATLEFQVRAPRDLSRRARFSRRLQNLGDYSHRSTAPTVTDVSVLAQGELTARVIRHRSTADAADLAWGRRIERPLDRRDSDDNPTLDAAGDELIAENGSAKQVSFEPLDLPSMRFFRDYTLSDIGTVETEWGTVNDRVRQVTGTLTKAGWRWKPLIGPASARDPNEPPSARRLKNLEKRTGRLEAR